MSETKTTLPDKNREYTIAELTGEYRKLNQNLKAALQIFVKIHETWMVDENDYSDLAKLNLNFVQLNVVKEELEMLGFSILESIINTIFLDLMCLANEFYGSEDAENWEQVNYEVKQIIIRNGINDSGMLKLYHKFYLSLVNISKLMEFTIYDDDPEYNEYFQYMPVDFETTMTKLRSIKNIQDKINYLNNEIKDKELICIQVREDTNFFSVLQTFIMKCKQALDILTRDIPLEGSKSSSDEMPEENIIMPEENPENPKNREFTTARQVLAVYYLLNEVDQKAVNQIDRTEKARFIEFLTGKNYKNIYKTLSDPFKGFNNKNNKRILNDLEYIKVYFTKLGLQSIVDKIDSDAG
jgi:hypothetical protein